MYIHTCIENGVKNKFMRYEVIHRNNQMQTFGVQNFTSYWLCNSKMRTILENVSNNYNSPIKL